MRANARCNGSCCVIGNLFYRSLRRLTPWHNGCTASAWAIGNCPIKREKYEIQNTTGPTNGPSEKWFLPMKTSTALSLLARPRGADEAAPAEGDDGLPAASARAIVAQAACGGEFAVDRRPWTGGGLQASSNHRDQPASATAPGAIRAPASVAKSPLVFPAEVSR